MLVGNELAIQNISSFNNVFLMLQNTSKWSTRISLVKSQFIKHHHSSQLFNLLKIGGVVTILTIGPEIQFTLFLNVYNTDKGALLFNLTVIYPNILKYCRQNSAYFKNRQNRSDLYKQFRVLPNICIIKEKINIKNTSHVSSC